MERSNNSGSPGKLLLVGLGPGSHENMSYAAREALGKSEVIVGYNSYIDLIIDIIADKKIIRNAMKGEVERVEKAIELARNGFVTSIVSRGDPGVYGMAGLALEICRWKEINLDIEIIPGITAANAAAASLGAPLMCDYAVISLSDLLIPWDVIKNRLIKIAESDIVTVIYNPKSKKRDKYIFEAQYIFLNYREARTSVGIVKDALTNNEHVQIAELSNFTDYNIDMRTVIIIGNSYTDIYKNWMFTRRGYKL